MTIINAETQERGSASADAIGKGMETGPADGARIFSRLRLSANTLIAVGAFVLAVIVMLMYKTLSQPEGGDPAIYDYIAQCIVKGLMPYRDVIDPKGPGQMYLSAAAMAVGGLFGINDVISVRLLNVILMGILSAVTFKTAYAYLRDRHAASIAFLFLLLAGQFPLMMNTGGQPKLPMMIFGLIALEMIALNKPVWSGFFGMLSCLCWQPGLMFVGTAVLIFSRYLTSWRDVKAIKVVAGAAAPLAVTFAYFQFKGALTDMWYWTIRFTSSVFAREGAKPLPEAFNHFWNIVSFVFHYDLALLSIAGIGITVYAFRRIRSRGETGFISSPERYRDALLFPPLVYLIFCLINFQNKPDLIPFFPFIGIFSGYFIAGLGRALIPKLPSNGKWDRKRFQTVYALLTVALLAAVALTRAARYKLEGVTLADQRQEAAVISGYLGPGDTMYVHVAADLLVLTHRQNLNPYISFGQGADLFISAGRPGGFSDVIDEMEARKPKLVALSRLAGVRHHQELEQWVQQHYDKLEGLKHTKIYIRKPE